MKKFLDYLVESSKSYSYVLKFAVKPSDEQLDRMNTWLQRYDLKEFTAPVELDNNHPDFIDIQNRHVHSVKIVLGLPISQYILLQDLLGAANMSEKVFVVRGENEPIERYAQFDTWQRKIDQEATENGETDGARLSIDREYTKAEQPTSGELFGDEYNQKLLTYLAGVASSRPSKHVDPPAPIFSWIQMEDVEPGEPKQDSSNFNAHIKDAPMPVSVGGDSPPIDKKWLTNDGTMVDGSVQQVKFLTNPKTGKSRQVTTNMEIK